MASNASERSRLLTAGAVLSIMGGALEAIGGGVMVGLAIAHRELFRLVGHGVWGGIPGIFLGPFGAVDLIWLIIVGVPIFALGIVAIIGGVSATRSRIFGLSLAGAICCQVASVVYEVMDRIGVWLGGVMWVLLWLILGLLAIIFICLSRKEFEVEGSSGMRGV